MKTLDLEKITDGLSSTWAGFLRDWDRTLRAGNHPVTTRYNYLLAAAQIGRYLAEHSPDPDADAAAADPCAVTRAHVESFQAWMKGAGMQAHSGERARPVGTGSSLLEFEVVQQSRASGS